MHPMLVPPIERKDINISAVPSVGKEGIRYLDRQVSHTSSVNPSECPANAWDLYRWCRPRQRRDKRPHQAHAFSTPANKVSILRRYHRRLPFSRKYQSREVWQVVSAGLRGDIRGQSCKCGADDTCIR